MPSFTVPIEDMDWIRRVAKNDLAKLTEQERIDFLCVVYEKGQNHGKEWRGEPGSIQDRFPFGGKK